MDHISFSEIDMLEDKKQMKSFKSTNSITLDASILTQNMSISAFKLQLEAESRDLDLQLERIRSKVRNITNKADESSIHTLDVSRLDQSVQEKFLEIQSNSEIFNFQQKNTDFLQNLQEQEPCLQLDNLIQKHTQFELEIIALAKGLRAQNEKFGYQLQHLRGTVQSQESKELIDEIEKQRNELHEMRNMLRNEQYTYYRYEALKTQFTEQEREMKRLRQVLARYYNE